MNSREVGLLSVSFVDKGDRLRNVSVGRTGVSAVTIGTTDVVAPVFAAPEVIAFLFAGVTGKARLGNLF